MRASSNWWRWRRARYAATALLMLCAIFVVAVPGTSSGSVLNANPTTLDGVFASAGGGDTIMMTAGDYGKFGGGLKAGTVVLQAKPGAAVSMELNFSPASNITIDGVRLGEVSISDSRTKNITVRNSDITGQSTLRTSELENAGILFDRNIHRDFDASGESGEGRVFLPGNTSQPSGITIQNSEFKDGISDGIQNGSNGTRIINNVFHDLQPGSPDGVHVDALQLFGSKNTLIRGNYFYNVPDAIVAADGADHEIIEDNVIAGDRAGYPFAVTLQSDDGSIIRHNTFADGACAFNLRCGIIALGCSSGEDAGRGTVIKDNILGKIHRTGGRATISQNTHNLFRSGSGSDGNVVALPDYVGGSSPSSYGGHLLRAGSPGKGKASDGLDQGIRVSASAVKDTPSSASATVRVLSTLRSIRATGKLRLRVRTTRTGRVGVSGLVRPGRALAGKSAGHSRKLIALRKAFLGLLKAGTRTVTIKLSSRARFTLGRSRGARLTAVVKIDAAVTKARLTIKRKL